MRAVGPLALALALLALAVGGASGLNPAGGVAQSGGEADLLCDEGGVQVSYSLTADLSAVNGVTVAGIDGDCKGAMLQVRVELQGGGTIVHTIASLTSGGSRSFNINPAVPVDNLVGVRVLIIGQDQEPPNKND
jgi:hypothetical protein